MGKRTLRETRELLGELLSEKAFLVKSVEDPNDKAIIQAANIDVIKKSLAGKVIGMKDQDPIVANDPTLDIDSFINRLSTFSPQLLKDAGIAQEKDLEIVKSKISRLPSNYKEAGEAAQALILDEASTLSNLELLQWLKTNFMNVMGETKVGEWTEIARKMHNLKSGGAAEVTGAGELSLYVTFLDLNKPKKTDFDLVQGSGESGKNISVKSFSNAGVRLGAGSAERERLEKEIDTMYTDDASRNLFKLTLKGNSVTPDELAKVYSDFYPTKGEETSKKLSTALFKSMTPDGGKLIGTAPGGWKSLEMQGDTPPIVITLVTAGRPKFNLAPGTSLGGYSPKPQTEWVPSTLSAKNLRGYKEELKRSTIADLLESLSSSGKVADQVPLARKIREIAVASGADDSEWRGEDGRLLDGGKLVTASRQYLERLVREQDRTSTEFVQFLSGQQVSETRLLLGELFPPRRPSLVTELALYSRRGLITEGAKEKAIDAVQFLIGAAVEYGIDVPTLGAGAPLGSAAETVIDAAFAAESITSAVDAIDSVVSKAGKFKDIFNSAMAARTKIKGDLSGFYADVKRIVQEGLELLGKDAQAKVKELSEELGKIVKGMIEKVLDPIGKAIKFLIPDATIGAAAAEAIKALLMELAENCFDMVKGALGKAGKFAKFITDPDAVPNFLEDAIPKLVTFLQQGAKKLEDTSLLKAAVTGGGAGIILKELGPVGLNKLAGILGDKKGDIVGLARKITGTLIPIVFTLLALMQVMLKGEYVSEDIEAKREKAKAAAGTEKETPKESKRLRGSVVSETHLLLRELGV